MFTRTYVHRSKAQARRGARKPRREMVDRPWRDSRKTRTKVVPTLSISILIFFPKHILKPVYIHIYLDEIRKYPRIKNENWNLLSSFAFFSFLYSKRILSNVEKIVILVDEVRRTFPTWRDWNVAVWDPETKEEAEERNRMANAQTPSG